MATLEEDLQRLQNDLAAQGVLITQISTNTTANSATIADLKAQLAALQGQVSPDLSGLEAGLTALEQNNAALAAILSSPTPQP